MRRLALLLSLAALSLCAADRTPFLTGVKDIAAPGAPGAISVFGPNAFAVVTGKEGDLQQPVVAASTLGKGRLVLLGHNGYIAADAFAKGDTGKLVTNALKWSAGKDAPRVGLLNFNNARKPLEEAGFTVVPLNAKDWPAHLKDVDTFLAPGEAPGNLEQQAALKAFIENGGGCVAATCPWGWSQVNGGKSLATEHAGNALYAQAGLVFADGTPDKTKGDLFDTTLTVDENTNAFAALELIQKPLDPKAKGAKRAVAQASATLIHALRSLPPTDTILLPKIEALVKERAAAALPTPQKPLKQIEHALERLILTKQLIDLDRTPLEKLTAHPAAQFFPGAIAADVPRVTKDLSLDARIPEWRSTGLYAAPGEKITVRIPADAVGEKFALRIGCHRDGLWHLDSWRRAPEMTRQWPLTQAETTIVNPFGGPIYLVVPGKSTRVELKFSVANAVEAPHYILGKTSAAEWKKIRERAVPWAEMETPRVIWTIPSEFIRTLEDPEPVMKFWVEFMDGTADLAAIPRERSRPERYVADTQISAGFMHSGYPIMMHYNEGKPCMDLQHLMTQDEPTWGYFHEMGHNHQKGDWTFSGTGEVTCNLFARYAFENLCKRPLADQRGHKNGDFAKNFRRYLAAGPDFEKWKSDPFLALYMYDQLLVAFGWDTYKKVFAEYRDLPPAQRPKSEEQKHDQWLTRFSRAAGKNLSNFFQSWGVPTSEAARKSLSDLPDWMPADWPVLK